MKDRAHFLPTPLHRERILNLAQLRKTRNAPVANPATDAPVAPPIEHTPVGSQNRVQPA